jgi:hypothetical protein
VAVGAQAADQIAECAIAIAKGLGNFGERAAVEKDGPQGFVTAVLRVRGLEEKIAAEGIVHVPCS